MLKQWGKWLLTLLNHPVTQEILAILLKHRKGARVK